MLEAEELIVLSDIHLGPENGKGLFRADKELVNCLNWILAKETICYVVLAGDIFDFLVLGEDEKSTDFYNLDNVGQRMENIINNHPDVFNVFAEIANSPNHHLLFIAGNHDPEVVFPEVQLIIEKSLRKSVESDEKKVSNSAHPMTRWTVHGESLSVKIGEAKVLIEHGNLFDKFNRVDHKSLRDVLSIKNRGFSVEGKDYYKPPFGSKLVMDYVNPIREEFPWLDYLHPGREATYPIMREFTSIKQKTTFLPALRDAIWAISNDLFIKVRQHWQPESKFRSSVEDKFLTWINSEIEKENRGDSRGFVFKSEEMELIKDLISSWKDMSDFKSPDSAFDDIALLLKQNTNLVVTGHTHQAKIYPIDAGLYINTGTWGQLLETPHKDEPQEVWEKFINNLRAGSDWIDESFLRPTLAQVKFDSNTGKTIASLIEWEKTNYKDISTWFWSSSSSRWEQ
jgi:UDP-2,3-diacylglucosamine pyrophosphatase LpxH